MATRVQKRKMAGKGSYEQAFDEFQRVYDVKHRSPKAKIHSVISSTLEDMKQGYGSSFFDDKLSDNHGYVPDVSRRLFIPKCRRIARQTSQLRMLRTAQQNWKCSSPKTPKLKNLKKLFTVPNTTSGKPVPLSDTDKMPTKTFITTEVKVCSVKEPIFIESKGLNCQEITVADQNGAARLSIWENEINTMKQGKGYRLEIAAIH